MAKRTLPEIPAGLLDDRVMSIDEVAATTKCCPETIRRRIKRGQGPKLIRLGERRVGVRVRDYRAWIESMAKAQPAPAASPFAAIRPEV